MASGIVPETSTKSPASRSSIMMSSLTTFSRTSNAIVTSQETRSQAISKSTPITRTSSSSVSSAATRSSIGSLTTLLKSTTIQRPSSAHSSTRLVSSTPGLQTTNARHTAAMSSNTARPTAQRSSTSSTSSTTPRFTSPTPRPVLTASNQSPGGVHLNVSTPSPPVSQGIHSPTNNDSEGSTNTGAIVAGILVPLIIFAIIALSVCAWYRKKYPVRMGLGRNFSTFTNPAYNKRLSTLTLVRDDGNKTFEDISNRNPALQEADDEYDVEPEEAARVCIEEEGVTYENLKLCPNQSTFQENTVINEVRQEENTTEVLSEIKSSEKSVSAERPKEKAVLFLSEESLENAFELVTEEDLCRRRQSELSSGNESTDTHTVSLSFSDVFDGRQNTKLRAFSENTLLLSSSKVDSEEAEVTDALIMKPRSHSDSLGQIKARSGRVCKTNADTLNTLTIPEKHLEHNVDESEKTDEKKGVELKEENCTNLELLNEKQEEIFDNTDRCAIENAETALAYDAVNGEMEKDSPMKSANKLRAQADESFEILGSSSETSLSTSSDHGNASEIIDLANEEGDNCIPDTTKTLEKKISRPSLQLSSENIVLDTVPPTPTIVHESFIFEPETPIPISLDSTSASVPSPRRGRRAFTLNDILPDIKQIHARVADLHNEDGKSKSSPEIFSNQVKNENKFDKSLKIDKVSYQVLSVSDSNINMDQSSDLEQKNLSLDSLPFDDATGENDQIINKETREEAKSQLEDLSDDINSKNSRVENGTDILFSSPKTLHSDKNTTEGTDAELCFSQTLANSHISGEVPPFQFTQTNIEQTKQESEINKRELFDFVSDEAVTDLELNTERSKTNDETRTHFEAAETTVTNNSAEVDSKISSCSEQSDYISFESETIDLDTKEKTCFPSEYKQDETLKKKISLGTFKLNMDEESDAESDSSENIDKTGGSSAEFVCVDKMDADVSMEFVKVDDDNKDGYHNDNNFDDSAHSIEESYESQDSKLSWEILHEDASSTNSQQNTKINISWEMLDENEDNFNDGDNEEEC